MLIWLFYTSKCAVKCFQFSSNLHALVVAHLPCLCLFYCSHLVAGVGYNWRCLCMRQQGFPDFSLILSSEDWEILTAPHDSVSLISCLNDCLIQKRLSINRHTRWKLLTSNWFQEYTRPRRKQNKTNQYTALPLFTVLSRAKSLKMACLFHVVIKRLKEVLK